MPLKIIAISLVLPLTLLAFSCSHKIPDPASPVIIDENVPPTPINLAATVGDRMIELTWEVEGDTSDLTYRVYMGRVDTAGLNYTLQTECAETSCIVFNLQNGVTFSFKVSAVNSDDFEGYKSDSVNVTPNHFGLIINSGLQYTSSRDVALTLIAPVATRFMIISEDSTFADVQWEPFMISRSFRLSAGDGAKTVFCRFRDPSDQETAGTISDSIELDTRAVIDSVEFSPTGVPFSQGSIVHFSLYTGETGGEAYITIGAEIVTIDLADDGLEGDAVAGDGIYEIDYTIGPDLDFEAQNVHGDFTDMAGNDAVRTAADYRISVRRPPDAVNIYSLTVPEGYFDRLRLAWSASNASDFAEYRVYRDTSPGVDTSDFLAETQTSRSATDFTDTDLLENTRYYYKVYVVDNTGLMTGSEEVDEVTGMDGPPEPVVLYPVVVLPDHYQEVSLDWSRCDEGDFASYRVFRWQEDIGRSDSTLIAIISEVGTTSFDDSPPFTVAEDTVNFWYILHLYDEGGNSAPSDSVRVHLIDAVPPTVSGSVEPSDNSLYVSWIASDIPDFGNYRLLRDTDSNPAGALTVFVTGDQQEVAFDDESAVQGQVYYYWLDIYDRRNNWSRSLLGSDSW